MTAVSKPTSLLLRGTPSSLKHSLQLCLSLCFLGVSHRRGLMVPSLMWTQPCIAWNILDSWKYVVVFWRSYGHLIYPHFTYILKSVYLLPEKSYQAFQLWVEITLNKCSCFGWLRFSDPRFSTLPQLLVLLVSQAFLSTNLPPPAEFSLTRWRIVTTGAESLPEQATRTRVCLHASLREYWAPAVAFCLDPDSCLLPTLSPLPQESEGLVSIATQW